MSKIKKTQISATIDIGVYNWLLRQDGKLSTNINMILKNHMEAADIPRKPVKIPLIELKGDDYDNYMMDHMAKINAELDRMQELEFSS
jgi:hypothetical protein